MKREQLSNRLSDMSTTQIAGGAVGLALLLGLAGFGAARLARRLKGSGDAAGRVPVQPAVDRAMPAQVPDHFTEELIIPGLTETGADVERQDDTIGRSPEGV